jgi:uncharacterized protein (UPF0276 family)
VSGCGLGLRREHYEVVLGERPAVPWFEVISENYMVEGGRPRHVLEQVRRDYPVALHGVSLSLGSAEPLDLEHLRRLKELVARVAPVRVSDHLCWTSLGGHNSHDLLPLPFTEEAVRTTVAKIRQVQDTLGRRLLVENISSYVECRSSTLAEWEFLAAVVGESRCGLLLDVNNLYVNARNHGFDPEGYLAAVPAGCVEEIHLAGHEDHPGVLIDTHDRPVCAAVWELYRRALGRFGPVPTLIERDAQLPPFDELLAEARRAEGMLEEARAVAQD